MRPLLVLLVLAIPASGVFAAELRVPSEYATINAALDAAVPGDSVLVAAGTYAQGETRTVHIGGAGTIDATALAFLKDGVSLIGEFGPDVTVLDMSDMVISEVGWGMVGGLLTSGDTLVQGFTITGAPAGNHGGLHVQDSNRITVRDCWFRDLDAGGAFGGGARIQETEAFFFGCRFERCLALTGGGISARDGAVTVDGCEFVECSKNAIFVGLGTPLLDVRNSRFVSNTTDGSGGAIRAGLTLSPIVADCVFEGNVAAVTGGAVSIDGPTTLERSIFWNNSISNTSGAVGGASLGGTQVTVRGNTFYGSNVPAGWDGVELHLGSAFPFTLENNIFCSSLGGGTAVLATQAGPLSVGCNIYWSNLGGNVAGFEMGTTDREADPRFCDPENGDFALDTLSPCLPPNSLGCGLIGALDQGCGVVSISASTWAAIKARYR